MAVVPDDIRTLFKGTDLDAVLLESEINAFISNATLIVTEELSGKGLSADRLELITKYLTGHFIILTIEQGGVRRSRTGAADESYVAPPPDRQGFATTRFGQQAIALDSSGTLASLVITSSMARAEFRVV